MLGQLLLVSKPLLSSALEPPNIKDFDEQSHTKAATGRSTPRSSAMRTELVRDHGVHATRKVGLLFRSGLDQELDNARLNQFCLIDLLVLVFAPGKRACETAESVQSGA